MSASAREAPRPYEVKADRVNVRIRPDLYATVLGQLAFGEVVQVLEITNTWAEIQLPNRFDAWVHGDFIESGRVAAGRLNVRGGPGINYQILTRVSRGTPIVERSREGEWLRIEPPPDSTAYVSQDLLNALPVPGGSDEVPTADAPTAPVVAPAPPPLQQVQPGAVRRDLAEEEPRADPPEHLTLVPLPGQGRHTEVTGILMKVGYLFGRPADYRLVENDGEFQKTICYVHAERNEVQPFLAGVVVIQGREFWYEGGRLPVVVPTDIRTRTLGQTQP